jgi:hypothetical protein
VLLSSNAGCPGKLAIKRLSEGEMGCHASTPASFAAGVDATCAEVSTVLVDDDWGSK